MLVMENIQTISSSFGS